jgi:ferrous-iron efflux pump FieF
MVDPHALSLTEAGRLMRRATVASMAVALLLVALKLSAWLITDSVSMLSSLVDSSLDLLSSVITFFAVRQALVPADADHRFGHGKAEALAGMAQAGFIAAAACAVLLTVSERFLHPRPVKAEMLGLAVSGLAIVLTLGLVWFQSHVHRRTGSIAVGADRAHYLTDLVTNLAVGGGVYLSSRLGQPLIDLVVAIGVAVYLAIGAIGIARQSLDVLMDRELPENERQAIYDIVRRHPGVRNAHDLRTRSGGLTRFIQLHVVLDPLLPLGRAHAIGDRIEDAILQAFPKSEILLHIDPWDDRADDAARKAAR